MHCVVSAYPPYEPGVSWHRKMGSGFAAKLALSLNLDSVSGISAGMVCFGRLCAFDSMGISLFDRILHRKKSVVPARRFANFSVEAPGAGGKAFFRRLSIASAGAVFDADAAVILKKRGLEQWRSFLTDIQGLLWVFREE